MTRMSPVRLQPEFDCGGLLRITYKWLVRLVKVLESTNVPLGLP